MKTAQDLNIPLAEEEYTRSNEEVARRTIEQFAGDLRDEHEGLADLRGGQRHQGRSGQSTFRGRDAGSEPGNRIRGIGFEVVGGADAQGFSDLGGDFG